MGARLVVLITMALVLLGGGVAPAGTSAAPALKSVQLGSSAVPVGTRVPVSGVMTVIEQPAARLWTDTTLPGDLLTFQYPTDPLLDLVEGSVRRSRPGDPFIMTIKVADTVVDTGGKPFMRLRWPFHLGDIWYFVTFNYVQNGPTGSWQGSWYYCRLALGSACTHGTTPPFPVTFDAQTRTFTGAIPLAHMAAVQPSGALVQDTMRPFSTRYPPEAGYSFPVLTWTQDTAPAFTPHDVPLESVLLGVAPSGSKPHEVNFSDHAAVSVEDGSLEVGFAGTVPTEGLAPGAYDLWVKACFGPCTTGRLPFTVT